MHLNAYTTLTAKGKSIIRFLFTVAVKLALAVTFWTVKQDEARLIPTGEWKLKLLAEGKVT